MKLGLDTSVVLRLLTGEPAHLATVAVRRVEAALRAGDAVLVSDLVAAETYFALQHHYGLSRTEALATLDGLLRSSGIEASGGSGEVLATLRQDRAQLGFVDRLIQAEYARIADEMLTFDRAAARLPRVRALRS